MKRHDRASDTSLGCLARTRDEDGFRRYFADQAGLTLLEMVIALLILSVILSAVAGSLISSARATAVNEHRVQATAHLTALHENLQAVPWRRVALYAEELDELDALGDPELDLDGTVPTYQGRDIVTIPGPVNSGCPTSNPDCGRLLHVPVAADTVVIDDREFDLFQIVTERTVGDADEPNIRRFTTIVRWRLLGRTYEEVFESERAPTPQERTEAQAPDVRLFLVSPRVVEVSGDGRNEQTIKIFARFQPGVTNAKILLPTIGGPTEVSLGTPEGAFASGDHPGFSLEILPGAYAFETGEQVVDLIGTTGAGVEVVYPGGFPIVVGEAPVDDGVPREPPEVVSASAQTDPLTSPARVGSPDGLAEDRMCQAITITATVTADAGDVVVDGAPPELAASVYFAGDRRQRYEMVPVPAGSIDPDGTTTFQVTLSQGAASPWFVPPGESFIDRFHVIAVAGIDGRDSSYTATDPITIVKPAGGSCAEL